jgi:3-hydroxyacyl-[acyl-carrier-protein] dehydratase
MTSPVYQHHFADVKDYLHHRAPYLLVSAIDSIGDRDIVTRTVITGEESFLAGHFPGSPIVPGAMLQEMTTQTAGILLAARFNPMEQFNTHDPFFNEYALGVLVRVKGARFRGFARPGNALRTQVELTDQLGEIFEFTGRVMLDGKTIMHNSFQLANILSRTLQGDQAQVSSHR